jgi:hypothetical protein
VLQYHFNWKTLSAMAGVTWWNFYFRLFPGTIRSPQVVEFLEHLLRHLTGKAVDRLGWVAQSPQPPGVGFRAPAARPTLAGVPLNPVEDLWSHWKQHELPNFCPQTFGQLSHHARQALGRMRRRPTLVIAFWRQADLFPL